MLKPTLILGVGNIIMGDDGFGVHVVRRLKNTSLPDHIRVEEGGVRGFGLLGLLEGVKQLIVVDVMMIDLEPGKISFFKAEQRHLLPHKEIISSHQVGIPEVVWLWGLIDGRPEVFFLVTRPQKIQWGTELSEPVKEAVEKAVAFLKRLCHTKDFEAFSKCITL